MSMTMKNIIVFCEKLLMHYIVPNLLRPNLLLYMLWMFKFKIILNKMWMTIEHSTSRAFNRMIKFHKVPKFSHLFNPWNINWSILEKSILKVFLKSLSKVKQKRLIFFFQIFNFVFSFEYKLLQYFRTRFAFFFVLIIFLQK